MDIWEKTLNTAGIETRSAAVILMHTKSRCRQSIVKAQNRKLWSEAKKEKRPNFGHLFGTSSDNGFSSERPFLPTMIPL